MERSRELEKGLRRYAGRVGLALLLVFVCRVPYLARGTPRLRGLGPDGSYAFFTSDRSHTGRGPPVLRPGLGGLAHPSIVI